MQRIATILGCGSSGGVPRVAQGWGACDPTNPKNRRRRCSLLVRQSLEKNEPREAEQTIVLIDTSPDLREQLLAADIRHLDGIFMTHPHADHIHGMDDVRPIVLQMKRKIDAVMDEATANSVVNRFKYIFQTPNGSLYPELLYDQRIKPGHSWRFDGAGGAIDVSCFQLHHGDIDALGLRMGDLAYTPDLNDIPRQSYDYLSGLDVWIIDALRYEPHASHLCVADALRWIDHFKPKRAILTNLNVELDYEELRAQLPSHIIPAYDGLSIDF
jgi:phosphoribosyl 1,2-cyclic phosphate phosphodiesterase